MQKKLYENKRSTIMTSTKTQYTILHNAHESTLIGSLHFQLSIDEYEQVKNNLQPQLLKADKVFIECPLPHYTNLKFGYERAVLEVLETNNQINKLHYFETNKFQQAMLASSVWIGTQIKSLPWLNYATLQKHPTLYLILSKATARLCWLFNIFYNIFSGNKHTLAVQQHNQETQKIVTEIYQQFKQGIAISLDKDSNEQYLMHDRNINMADIIQQSLSDNKQSVFIVGTAHLPNNNGIVHLLQEKGITLE